MATARNTLAVAIKLDGTAQAKKEFEDVGKAGEKAFAAIARAADRISPGLGTRLQGSLRALRGQFLALQAAGARFAQSTATLALALNTVGVAAQNSARRIGLITAAATGAIAAVALFAKRSGENAERIVNQAEALGISTEAYQNFETAAKNAGLSQQTFDQVLARFVTNAAKAGDGLEGVAEDAGKLSQSLRQIEVTAEDGAKKLITIRGTSETLAKSIKTVGSATKGTEQDLIDFAKRIEALPPGVARLKAIMDAGFSQRIATQVERVLLAIARNADPAARALNKVLEPLTEAEKISLLGIDTAFDRLGDNLSRIQDQVSAIFGPAVAELINGIADAIFNNQRAIREFAKEIADNALIVVRDLFALLRGDDAAVQNKGLITFRDTVIQIGNTVRGVFESVIVPAFKSVVAVADQVAKAVNSVFGTQFSGLGLIVTAAIFQIVGGFRLLLSVLALTAAGFQFFRDAGRLLLALRPILTGLVGLLARFSAGLVALAIANPLLAAVLALGAGLAYLALREKDAERAARLHQEALEELNQKFIEAKAGVEGAAEGYREVARAKLQAAQAALALAQAQVQEARAAVQAAPQFGGSSGDRGAGIVRSAALANEQKALDQLEARKRDLVELNNQIIAQNESLQRGSDATTVATSQYSAEVAKASTATRSLESNVRKVDPAFTEAAIAARQLGQELQSGVANPEQIAQPFEAARARITQAVAETRSSVISAWSGMVEAMESRFSSLVGVVQSVASQIERILASVAASIARTAAAARSAGSSRSNSGLGTSRFASGGSVSGPGTGTSDSILAWLSNGEFVIKSASVRKLGLPLLNALNSGRFDFSSALSAAMAVPRLATGGPVAAPAGASLRPVTVNFGGQSFSMMAGGDVVRELQKAAISDQTATTGRMPSWWKNK